MKKTIAVKKDESTGEFYLDVDEFIDLFDDPDKIDSYSLEWDDSGTATLCFYDADGNKLYLNKK